MYEFLFLQLNIVNVLQNITQYIQVCNIAHPKFINKDTKCNTIIRLLFKNYLSKRITNII